MNGSLEKDLLFTRMFFLLPLEEVCMSFDPRSPISNVIQNFTLLKMIGN